MRNYEGGPLPFDVCWEYASVFCEMDWYQSHSFVSVLRQMDVVYLDWLAKERERLSKTPPPKKTGGQSKGSSKR